MRGNTTEESAREPEGKAKEDTTELPCPVLFGQQDPYALATIHCGVKRTYKGMQRVNEHIKDYHSPDSYCSKCMKSFAKLKPFLKFHTCKPSKPQDGENERRPILLPPEVIDQLKNWKQTIGDQERSEPQSSAVHFLIRRWQHAFRIINPNKEIPDPLSIISQAPPPQPPLKRSRPSAPQSPTPSSSSQRHRKRRSSPSSTGQRRDKRRRQVKAGIDGVPNNPRAIEKDGDGGVTYETSLPPPESIDPATLDRGFRSTYSADDVAFAQTRNLDMPAALSYSALTMSQGWMDLSEASTLPGSWDTPKPASTAVFSDATMFNDCPSPSTVLPPVSPLENRSAKQETFGTMGNAGEGGAVDPPQYNREIEEEDSDLVY
ncbi:hypothetical protein VTG60DRAFT_6986 [Thermothelomyces hinnuleus]